MEKTKGQLLYEHDHPKHIDVYSAHDHFRIRKFSVLNPVPYVEWKFLSTNAQEAYEKRAIGHYIFSEKE